MTIPLTIAPEDVPALKEERYSHPLPIVQRRMEALWLKSQGLPHAQIATLVGVCENTVREYFELYRTGGLDALRIVHFYRPQSELDGYATSLEAYFKEHPPASIKQAQDVIEKLTDIRRSPTQIRHFLKKNSICIVAKSA